jgi:alkylation response protein AidB-like acyl-CoA dehydrogenase
VVSDLIEELDAWLDANWDPDLTVGEWWERLGLEGWAAPSLPTSAYGRGVSRADALAVSARLAARKVLGPPAGLGVALAAPTIAVHGTPAQIDELVRPIVTGQKAWCQLFSEPGAGSDLAGLGTRAVRDGDEWVVNGQKVWTSAGHIADLGMLVARTNPDAPKHQGITWFAIDMHQGAAVDVRPLREMTGRALFNEVFLSDARTPDRWVIGGTNNGWAVANSTLTFERQGLAAGGQGHSAPASPGTVVGDLAKRAGDFVGGSRPGRGGAGVMVADSRRRFVDLARAHGRIDDPTIRQRLMQLHTLNEMGRYTNVRMKAERARGRELPGAGNLGKLAMSQVVRASRDLGLELLGPLGTLHAYSTDDRRELDEATGRPEIAYITEMALFAQAPPIYGGTDQIQRNIVGERVLGLPKEPGDDRAKPWSELPRNG